MPMKDVKEVVCKIKKLKIDTERDVCLELINACGESEDKHLVLRAIISSFGSPSTKLSLIFSLVSKLKSQYDNKLVQEVLEYVKSLKELDQEDYEWIAKIVFIIIENIRDRKRNDEIKLLVMETLQKCSQEIDIMTYLFNFMLNENSGDIVYALLVFIPEICDSFVRTAIQQTNINILKNVSYVLSALSSQFKSLFLNYKHFEVFLDSEHHFLRNCYLDIITNLVELFKELNKIEEIVNIISILEERLSDIYFNVRYKAINHLGALFQSNSVPMNIRNRVIQSIGERVLDKTIIVRKRALSICSFILMNHPFKTESSLKRKNEICVDENKVNVDLKETEKYFNDLNDFHDAMKGILDKVVLYFQSKAPNDIQVFIEFVKLSHYYEIEGSKKAFELIFDFIYENEGESIASCFSDIIIRLKMRKIQPYDLLKQFVTKEGNPSFERIIIELWKRKVIDNELHSCVLNKFLNSIDLFESSYLLRFIPKHLELDSYFKVLQHSTSVLFSVTDSSQLDEALSIYCNVLKIKVIKKVEPDSPILNLITKNLAKMVFFDYRTVQFTILSLYSLSLDVEKSVSNLLSILSLKNVNSLKVIYSVGCIGVTHLAYLEKLERACKVTKGRTRLDSIVPEDIKERRKSINAFRMSIQSFVQEDGEFDVEEFTKNIKNKSEDELADFFFFLKKKDILYNPSGLLYGYSKDIPKLCIEGSQDIQEVAHLALFQLMCLSSEYFLTHKKLLKDAFLHNNFKIRSNAVIAMGDFLLYFNSMVEDMTPLLFESLNDTNITVKKNSILVIFSLLKRNIIRVSGCSIHLSRLIFDEDEEIQNITKSIISTLSDNENFITTLLYERLTIENNDFRPFVDLFIPFLKDKAKESIFLKLLRANLDTDVLNYIFAKFNFNEKFSEDLKLIEEFKVVTVN